MKCQNCGKNEINFHYSSNVNGCVTETHLCSECAAKSGYDLGSMFNMGSIFEGFSPISMQRMFLPIPMFGHNLLSRLASWPQTGGLPEGECACGETCETTAPETQPAEVDAEMLKRREINIMREQMRLAADKDDFEKAAEIRDQIKQMEAE